MSVLPPQDRIDVGKHVFYALDESERQGVWIESKNHEHMYTAVRAYARTNVSWTLLRLGELIPL